MKVFVNKDLNIQHYDLKHINSSKYIEKIRKYEINKLKLSLTNQYSITKTQNSKKHESYAVSKQITENTNSLSDKEFEIIA